MNDTKAYDIIIFGGHGDLALSKLIPALFQLFKDNYINAQSRIISVSREQLTNKQYSDLLTQRYENDENMESFDPLVFKQFVSHFHYLSLDLLQEEAYKDLSDLLDAYPLRERINYLSTASSLFGAICRSLSARGLITAQSRVVLEKPIGKDLESSRLINDEVLKYFTEHQIYRIDHYLGKETVQNIMPLRFSNQIFMPLWNSNYIDHIQITVAEEIGVEGRWGYYDEYGAMRDMIQNHLMQLLCLVAMEPPCSLDADNVRDEKVKVVRSLRPMDFEAIESRTVRAQYTKGAINGQSVPGYCEGEGVSKSKTETYAAMRINIDNWRWNGVPFYLRSGKRLHKRNSEIVIQFKELPYSIFANNGRSISQNKLVISLQPKESITLKLMNKIPGLTEQMQLQPVELELNPPNTSARKYLAYERLILDVLRSNPTHFMRLDEVEASWRWSDAILKGWQANLVPMKSYAAGTDGPTAAIAMIERDGRSWHEE